MNSARGWLALAIGMVAALGVAVAAADSIRTSSLDAVVALMMHIPAAQPPPAAASRRVGRALESRLLYACAPEGSLDGPPDPRGTYWLMKTGVSGARMTALVDASLSAAAQKTYARDVAELTECIYRQDAASFCQPDNRALAVETITLFGRMLDASGDIAPDVRDRVLSTFRNHVQDGRLTAADFGFFVPKNILDLIRAIRPAKDACARG